jgi:peroxiredoxin (alkyl hydroperoxide reductase subunit C)
MPKDFKAGCAQPKKEVVLETNEVHEKSEEEKNEEDVMIKVGQKAPNFELPGFHEGEFKSFELSEFKGKWVVLCFYPGDFTFV